MVLESGFMRVTAVAVGGDKDGSKEGLAWIGMTGIVGAMTTTEGAEVSAEGAADVAVDGVS